ncbi:MAG TPA: 4-alpha-glucanotransferase, partial [Lacipirellula sp.]
MIKTAEFRELLRDCRVLGSYEDVSGRRRRASVDSLLALLRSLGVDIESPDQAGDVLRERRRARLNCGVQPVLVAWDGRLKAVELSLPPEASGAMTYELIAEDGGHLAEGKANVEDLKTIIEPEETTYEFVTHQLPIIAKLPMGYHRLHVTIGEKSCHSLVVSAPGHAYLRADEGSESPQRHWCPFLPLYALRTELDWGAGDFRGLSELAQWAGQLGAGAVGTLPLLAASLDEPFEPSPYRPVSRKFWNELYIDVESINELRQCETARQLVA